MNHILYYPPFCRASHSHWTLLFSYLIFMKQRATHRLDSYLGFVLCKGRVVFLLMATSLPPESLYPPFCPWPYGSALSQEASEEKKANHQQERWRSLIAGCCSVVSWSLADIHSMCLWRVWATHLFSFPHVIIKHPFSVFISMALQVKWNTIGPYFKLFTPGLDLSLCCHCRRGSCVDAEWSMRTFVANGGATCIGELNHRCSVLLIDLFFSPFLSCHRPIRLLQCVKNPGDSSCWSYIWANQHGRFRSLSLAVYIGMRDSGDTLLGSWRLGGGSSVMMPTLELEAFPPNF